MSKGKNKKNKKNNKNKKGGAFSLGIAILTPILIVLLLASSVLAIIDGIVGLITGAVKEIANLAVGAYNAVEKWFRGIFALSKVKERNEYKMH